MPSPVTTTEAEVAKTPEKYLSDALRETFQNLDIKDLTPEAIIKRFNKSGGIDRVRIAIERRMKEVNDAQKRHTVAASEDFLNEAVPEGSAVPQPQDLMKRAQDVVLATVKDRIGRDVDTVTEQGKAPWFFECVRHEIVSACKYDETVTKEESEPAPATKVLDGAKAILASVTRNVARARQAEHDARKVIVSGEKSANSPNDAATNGKLVHDDEKEQHPAKRNVSRIETKECDEQKEDHTGRIGDSTQDRKENKMPRDERPSSGNTVRTKATEQKKKNDANTTEKADNSATVRQAAKDEAREEVHPNQGGKGNKDLEALADDFFCGSSDSGEDERGESEVAKKPESGQGEKSDPTLVKTPERNRSREDAVKSHKRQQIGSDSVKKPEGVEGKQAESVGKAEKDKTGQDAVNSVQKRNASSTSQLEKTLHKRPEPQSEQNNSAKEEENRSKQPQDSTLPLSPDTSVNAAKAERSVESKAAGSGHGKNLAKPMALESGEVSEMEVEEKPLVEQSTVVKAPKVSEMGAEKGIMRKKPHVQDLQMTLGGTTTPASHQEISGDEKMKEVLPQTPNNTNEERPMKFSASASGTENANKDTELADSDKLTNCDKEEEREYEVSSVAQEKIEKKGAESNGKTQKAEDISMDVDVIHEEPQAEELESQSKKSREETEEAPQKSMHQIRRSRSRKGAASDSKTSKTIEGRRSALDKEDVSKLELEKEAANTKDVRKSERADRNRSRRRSEADPGPDQTASIKAMSPTRGSSRRLSSRLTSKKEPVVVNLKNADAEKAAEAKVIKRPRGRPKKNRDESTDRPDVRTQKTGKEDPTRNGKQRNEKKRRRSETNDERSPSQTQGSTDPLDPSKPGWPRGYGCKRSCVPQDYTQQQKVLHALRMLLEKECASPFSEAVDISEKGLESYRSIIKNPMDLGEICNRLENTSTETGYYLNQAEVMQDIELVWWNCKKYNGQFDPIIGQCDQSQHELAFLLEQHGIEQGKGSQKRRRVSRGPDVAAQKPEKDVSLGDNDGSLVGKSVLVFTEFKKGKKEWCNVEVKAYDKKSRSYTLKWVDRGKTTKKATFGLDKMYPVYRT